MLARVQDIVIRVSRTWWLWLIVTAIFAGSLFALMTIGAAFPAHASGAAPFDLQNGLTVNEVYPQISGYSEAAKSLYVTFTLIDYVFPLFAGLFIASTVAFALRNGMPRLYEALRSRRLLPVFFLATLFDWLENVAALTTIVLYPQEHAWLPALLVAAKRLKLAGVFAGQGFLAFALLMAAGRWLLGRLRSR